MRKSFDGLPSLVREHLELDPFAGHLFVFTSRRQNQTRFCIPIGLRCGRVPLASAIRQKAARVSTNGAWSLTPQNRLQLRQVGSHPILDKLHNYLLETEGEVLPKSPEGRAVRYSLKNRTALTRHCEDGDLEIDNNATERSIRGVAVGRHNWTFFGSDRGGRTAAVLRSLVASCQRVGIDPFTWLKDVLSRISTHPITRVAELLPHNWGPAHA